MSYGVVRTDKIRAIYNGHIHSVVYNADILENGMIGAIGGLVGDEREVRELLVPTTATPIALIAMPEINYSEHRRSDFALENFHIPQGTIARAYDLERNDIFSVSRGMVTAINSQVGAVKGNYVIADGSLRLKEVATVTGNEAFQGKVLQRETIGTTTIVGQAGNISRVVDFVVIEVLKNHI